MAQGDTNNPQSLTAAQIAEATLAATSILGSVAQARSKTSVKRPRAPYTPRIIPDPNYEYEINALVEAFKQAVSDIQHELASFSLTTMQRANSTATLANISDILRGLNADSAKWAETHIPKVAQDGVVRALMALGLARNVVEAQNIARFNSLNKDLIRTAVADTQHDVLAVTQNIERRTRVAVRQAAASAIRSNMAQGINGRRTIGGDMTQQIRQQLGASADNAIIDAAGRRWRVETYTDMLTRTKLMNAHMEATRNEALGRGVMYGKISSHGAKDSCGPYEGTIVKLVDEAPGDYPSIDELRGSNKIFHPNCSHLVNPIRNPEDV